MKRHLLEQNVVEAAEICVDSGGVKYIQLAAAVKALRNHQLQMPTAAIVGGRHPVTSKQAAEWMTKNHPDLCARVFREIWSHWTHNSAGHGLTTDEIQQAVGGSHQSISPRLTQLRNEGWIHDAGIRRKTRSGRLAIVWCPTPAAIAATNPYANGDDDGRLF